MNNELILKFILEEKKDYRLYQRFLEGSWYPNIDEYKIYVNRLNRNNKLFAKTIKRYNLIHKSDEILETSPSKEYTVSEYLGISAKIINTKYGEIKYIEDNLVNHNTCYISNGYYEKTKDLVYKLLNYGSFIIGISDNKESQNYIESLENYKELLSILKKKKINTTTYKNRQHEDKLLMITYRRDFL